jgi:hypothetical protein
MKNIKRFTFVECVICLLIAGIIFSPQLAKALEFQADKNVAFNFTVPLVNSTNTSIYSVGNNNTACYINSNDNVTFAAAAVNITRIDAGGIYLFQLNTTEMNHDRVNVYYNGTGALQDFFRINTMVKEAVDNNNATISSVNTTLADVPNTTEFNARSLASADYFVVGDYTVPPNVSQIQAELEENGASLLDTIADAIAHGTYGLNALLTAIGTRMATFTLPGNFSSLNVSSDGNVSVSKTGYSLTTAPPTKAEIRAEMDANSTKLTAINDTISNAMVGF